MKKYQNNTIESTVEEAANRFSRTLDRFYPAYGKNAICERNLSFQFSNVFVDRANSYAIMEIPFPDVKTQKKKLHIDAYLFDDKIGIFLESKRLLTLPKAREVCNDLFRMNSFNLSPVIRKLQEDPLPKKFYALVLCESWSPRINNWWVTGKGMGPSWDNLEFPRKMCYGLMKDIKTWDDGSLSWLYGYKQIHIKV